MAQEAEIQNGAVTFSSIKVQVMVPATKAEEAVQFYKAAFAAEEVNRSTYPKRKADQETPLLLCAELKIGSSAFLVCDQTDDSSPAVGKEAKVGGIVFRVETEEVEKAVAKAVTAGAVLQGDIVEEDGCCGGGIVGKLVDPFGVSWIIAPAAKKCGVEATA
ncbi:uncharacterized protein At5g48480 [Typha latifolia]|uniref:uncharacterized protein At5g48480 n=1 Tax=Typha latifolia TaxID=4733 RepID=UPI003C2F5C67